MAGLHADGGIVSLVAAGTLAVVAGGAALIDRGHAVVRPLAWLTVSIFAAQGLVGFVALLAGGALGDLLHLLYAAGLVAVIPLASRFADEAPDRARSGVLAVAGLLAIGLVWRLFATG